MMKPLIFRRARYGAYRTARRNNVEYDIVYSMWYDGKEVPEKYHVERVERDGEKYKNRISTHHIKRFTSCDAAQQFCQDLYEGKINLESLTAEIEADDIARKNEAARIIKEGADSFTKLLKENGVDVKTYLMLNRIWNAADHEVRQTVVSEAGE